MKRLAFGLGAGALLHVGACAEGPATTKDDFGYKGTGIEFSVAPLTLETLADACYSFTIENGELDLVVGRGPGAAAAYPGVVTGTAANTLCASQFGNSGGGDISYVAPCDAQQPSHTVTLWVDALCVDPALTLDGTPNYLGANGICEELQSYVNPCGGVGCRLQVDCVENADTPVTFNFTIMGQADQGFFDIAVNFDDVFCSAKLDTCYPDGTKIDSMFDVDGNRIDTIVAAVACTGGPGDAVETRLTMSNLMVGCIDPTSEGPHELDISSIVQEGNTTIGPWPAAVYYGTESLNNVNKVFTTVAIGIGDWENCFVGWQVVPSNGAHDFGTAGEYNSFGYISFEANGIGGTACSENPLNGTSSAVRTVYYPTAPLQPSVLDAQLIEGDETFDNWP